MSSKNNPNKKNKQLTRVIATISGVIDVGMQPAFELGNPPVACIALIFTTTDGELMAKKYSRNMHPMSALSQLAQMLGVNLSEGISDHILNRTVALSVVDIETSFPKITEVMRLEEFDDPMPSLGAVTTNFVLDLGDKMRSPEAKSWIMSLPTEVRRLIGSRVVPRIGGDHE